MKLRLSKHHYPGKLIVFEGIDGAGKTTLIGRTRDYLVERLGEDKLLLTRQPTDVSRKTELFQKMMYSADHLDVDYRAVQLLTVSDRLQHEREAIEPALYDGKTVICDRYIYTSLANMTARGYIGERWFFDAARHIMRPDATFLAYAPPETAIERIKARPEEAERYLDEAHLRKTAANFCRMSKKYGFVELDTTRPIDITVAELLKKLDSIYGWEGK